MYSRVSQVENVLRISQLERSNQPIQKTIVDTHKIIVDAVSHIQLILKDKSGDLKMHLNAKQTSISGNKSHLTNVVVNLLDNAVKYCDQIPKVMVDTFNEDNSFIIKIKDNGIEIISKKYESIVNFMQSDLTW